MPRSLWTGSLSFGLVNVPVKMYGARTDKSVRFNQLNPETGNRLKQRLVDSETGVEVSRTDAVKGFQVADGGYVVVTDDDLRDCSQSRSETIEIERFVDASDVDPMYPDQSYYLGASTGGAKAYALLSAAMAQTGRVGIGRFVNRNKERVVAIRVLDDGVISLSTLSFYDEFTNGAEHQPDSSLVTGPELAMGVKLVEQLAGDFKPSEYRDEYRAAVERVIEAKAAGLKPAPAPEQPERKPAVDLMAALEASLTGGEAAVPEPQAA